MVRGIVIICTMTTSVV